MANNPAKYRPYNEKTLLSVGGLMNEKAFQLLDEYFRFYPKHIVTIRALVVTTK